MIILGITGSIGMGKSTAAEMLRDMGVPIHDSGGAAVMAVGLAFPESMKMNEAGLAFIDRQILGRIVFSDRSKKKDLEDLLHPLVRAESDHFIAEMRKKNHRMSALDIPFLFETGWEKRVDVTLCVSAPKEVQRERVLARPGMTSEKFDRIVAGQLPDAEKRKRADYVVETDQSFDAMRGQLQKIVEELLARKGATAS